MRVSFIQRKGSSENENRKYAEEYIKEKGKTVIGYTVSKTKTGRSCWHIFFAEDVKQITLPPGFDGRVVVG